MGNTLNLESTEPLVSDDPVLKEYKAATIDSYLEAKEGFDALQATVGDKMTVTQEEFDEIFGLVCEDPLEHFELFDSWQVGQVDAMEVFAVIIVYCSANIEEKIPLLFELFDFDHSKEISEHELVLLLLCTTRGLCKVLGLPRPATDTLEALATNAFAKIDGNHSGHISLEEFSHWALNETSVLAYLSKFTDTRVIYENQIQCDLMMKEICTTFVNFAEHQVTKGGQCSYLCPVDICEEIIQRHCSAAEQHEVGYLLRTMETGSLISLDTFCLVMTPFVAFLAADDDDEHLIHIIYLKVLVWLLRGSEPSDTVVDCFKNALDPAHDGNLNAMTWISCALEVDRQTGSQSFATQLHLLFATADLKGDAMISPSELQAGLVVAFADHLARVKAAKTVAPVESAWGGDLTTQERANSSRFSSVGVVVAQLAKEVMEDLELNQLQRVEWYEFRQHLAYLEQYLVQTKTYIQDHEIDE